ncbi:MAG: carboxypeptidase-like regulatory domain-containing protein [Candidatus Acidiferrales bacterium]
MRATRITSSVALFLAVLVLSGVSVRAQDDRDRSQLRTVHGSVMDKDQNPIANGIVYLHNKKTNNIRTQISDSQGHYQFTGLDPNDDFEIHAEFKRRKSSKHTISSFDSRNDIEINLTIPTDK